MKRFGKTQRHDLRDCKRRFESSVFLEGQCHLATEWLYRFPLPQPHGMRQGAGHALVLSMTLC